MLSRRLGIVFAIALDRDLRSFPRVLRTLPSALIRMLKVFPFVLHTYVEDLSMRLTRKVFPRAVFSRLVVLPALVLPLCGLPSLRLSQLAGLRYPLFGLLGPLVAS